MNLLKAASTTIVLVTISVVPVAAQNVHVEVRKEAGAIPRACESIVPATVEGQVDIPALVKEANCKGAGDLLAEYTYVLKYVKREKGKKGEIKDQTRIYEVYLPTLPNGTRGRGVLLVTSRDGVLVPPDELAKESLRAAQRLEKAENEIARSAVPQAPASAEGPQGMLPLGSYPSVKSSAGKFGIGQGSAVLDIHTFLKTCELTLLRREQHEGSETLVFSFRPRPDAQFSDNEKYVASLRGTIWIDAKDRIVTRLVGWPANAKGSIEQWSETSFNESPPAVYVEMIRLKGIWLPRVTRLNGADHAQLFDHIAYDATLTYSDYIRFTTEIKDVKVETPKASP